MTREGERHIRNTGLAQTGDLLYDVADLHIIDEEDLVDIIRLSQ